MTPGDLVTSDIENFWRAFDLAESSDKKHHPEIYREVYFDQGSIGLQDFITLRIESAESLVETVEKHLREQSSRFCLHAFRKFVQHVIPKTQCTASHDRRVRR